MKWNRVGINEYDILAVVIILFISPFLVFASIGLENGAILAFSIFFLVFFLGISALIITSGVRKYIALKGKRMFGVIKDKERTRDGYLLCIEYRNELEENKEFYQVVEKDVYTNIRVGTNIPIYVNNKCAAFKEEELILIEKKSFVEVKKRTKCPYCDKEYDGNYGNCPYCGAIKL